MQEGKKSVPNIYFHPWVSTLVTNHICVPFLFFLSLHFLFMLQFPSLLDHSSTFEGLRTRWKNNEQWYRSFKMFGLLFPPSILILMGLFIFDGLFYIRSSGEPKSVQVHGRIRHTMAYRHPDYARTHQNCEKVQAEGDLRGTNFANAHEENIILIPTQ